MVVSPGKFIVGGDLGGTRFRVVLANHRGTIVERAATLTMADEGRDAVIQRMVKNIEHVMQSVERESIVGVGIAAPGPLNPWTGVVYSPPNLPGWGAEPLKDILESAINLPCHVGNDANLAALAEHQFGAGRGTESMIYLTVSTGIGGGVIDHGRLLLGQHGLAGEVGHITIEPNGPRCGCGNMGCLEALASGPSLAREALKSIRAGETSGIEHLVDGRLEAITGEVVVTAAHQGDRLAIQIVHRAATYLGIGVANLIHLFNPEAIVIGGGVSNAGELLFEPVRQQVATRVMPAYHPGLRIVQAELGDDVGVLGAVALAMMNAS
jgi:glucokinase